MQTDHGYAARTCLETRESYEREIYQDLVSFLTRLQAIMNACAMDYHWQN